MNTVGLLLVDAASFSAKSPKTARLLPAFDPGVAGASRRAAALLDPQHKARVYRAQGWISSVLLVNGRRLAA
jgi:Winged helix DNA-binding domain